MKESSPQRAYDFQTATKKGFKLGLGVGGPPGILFCAVKLFNDYSGPNFMESLTEMETIKETALLATKILGISLLAGVTLTNTQVLIDKLKGSGKNNK